MENTTDIDIVDHLQWLANSAKPMDAAAMRLAAAEIARLRLTDAEREAVEAAARIIDAYEDEMDGFSSGAAATLRGLLERLPPVGTPASSSTPAECRLPPEWTSRPYWVDPPSGHRYGFPRLYDPANDGNMTEWMIRHGYPEALARQGLVCTFTACEEK